MKNSLVYGYLGAFVMLALSPSFVFAKEEKKADEVPLAADKINIGAVDLQKAFMSVKAGQQVKAQLEKEFLAKKKDLRSSKRRNEFKKNNRRF